MRRYGQGDSCELQIIFLKWTLHGGHDTAAIID
eukprot:SAG11_NODE_28775_length_318_cov_0.675799_1_plen_32_part_10